MIEKLLKLVVDQNKLAPPRDELSELFNIDELYDEIDELELEMVTAARLEVKQTSEKNNK